MTRARGLWPLGILALAVSLTGAEQRASADGAPASAFPQLSFWGKGPTGQACEASGSMGGGPFVPVAVGKQGTAWHVRLRSNATSMVCGQAPSQTTTPMSSFYCDVVAGSFSEAVALKAQVLDPRTTMVACYGTYFQAVDRTAEVDVDMTATAGTNASQSPVTIVVR
jgi:hypothetical protein